jgi:hypothetical protein
VLVESASSTVCSPHPQTQWRFPQEQSSLFRELPVSLIAYVPAFLFLAGLARVSTGGPPPNCRVYSRPLSYLFNAYERTLYSKPGPAVLLEPKQVVGAAKLPERWEFYVRSALLCVIFLVLLSSPLQPRYNGTLL